MELAALPSPDLLAAALPESRAAPAFGQDPDAEAGAAAASLPFAVLLGQAAAAPLPAGESLPPSGNSLPVGAALPGASSAIPWPIGSSASAGGAMAPTAAPPSPSEVAASAAGAEIAARTEPPAELIVDPDAASAESASTPDPDSAERAVSWLRDAAPGSGSPAATVLAAPGIEVPLPTSPAPSVVPAQDLTKPQPAARVLAALTAASASAEGAARVPTEQIAAQDARGADSALRQPAPALAFDGLLSADEAGSPAADVPLAARGAELGDRPPLPMGGFAEASSAASAAPTHGLGSGPSTQAAAPATAHTQAQPPGHPHGGVDTTAARWNETLANRIHWLVDHDIGEARIKLNPAELGALDVKISLQDDKTYVQLTAHNASARDELAQSLPRLRELLTAHGLELGGATVSGGRDERPSHAPYGAPAVRGVDGPAPNALDELPRAARNVRSQIDLFA